MLHDDKKRLFVKWKPSRKYIFSLNSNFQFGCCCSTLDYYRQKFSLCFHFNARYLSSWHDEWFPAFWLVTSFQRHKWHQIKMYTTSCMVIYVLWHVYAHSSSILNGYKWTIKETMMHNVHRFDRSVIGPISHLWLWDNMHISKYYSIFHPCEVRARATVPTINDTHWIPHFWTPLSAFGSVL